MRSSRRARSSLVRRRNHVIPLIEIASTLAGILDDDPTDVALAKLRSSIERVVASEHADQVVAAVAWTMGLALPQNGTGIGGGGDVRAALHQAWARYLGALAHDKLLVVVLEDVHWASEPLLDLVDDLLDALADAQTLVVCPARPELLTTRPTWGAGRLNAASLTLTPLDRADSERLLRALLDSRRSRKMW